MPNIRHEVLIGAPPEDKCSVQSPAQEGLSGWWTPDAAAQPVRDSIARFPFGPTYVKEMRITNIEPPTRLNWTCITGCDEWVGTKISFELHSGSKDTLLSSRPELYNQIQQETHADGTLLVLHHDGWQDYTPMFAECNYTWGQFLRSLKLLCETGEGRPWPHQHRTEPEPEPTPFDFNQRR